MKRVKAFAALLTAVIITFAISLTAFADETITVNGQQVKAGDTVTFEFRMSGLADPLEAAGAFIEYDPNALEYIEDSIGFDVFKNAMYNIVPGKIYYSAIDVINGFDLKEEQMIVRLSFTVLDGAKQENTITHSFDEIFTLTNEEENVPESDYTANEIVTVNSYKENDAPFFGIDANDIEELQQSSETDFDNLMLGTDMEEFIASNADAGNNSAEQLTSSPESGKEAAPSAAETVGTSSQAQQKTPNTKAVVIIMIAIFIALVIVMIVLTILKRNATDEI